ncbi:MAG: alkene reductase [Deltaproteobacteria bacterium]|nr:alkene reductase [Deltaproteobacteria bacterium]
MKLLESLDLGGLVLPNRIVMAPMTRSRAHDHGKVGPLQATYYAQRASAGLIVSEGVNISPQAIGSPFTPGLYDDAQVEAWKTVTDTVHAAGGRIFAQLWHTGRVGHSSVRGGALPVAPSAIGIVGQQAFTAAGPVDYETPHALTTEEVVAVIADYRTAAVNAKRAGFDGVELHGAFGYLPNQFLVDGANHRTDAYGGSIANRARFTLEIMAALVDVWGPGRAGIKLSPTIPYNSISDSDPLALFTYVIEQLDKLPLAYLHLMQGIIPLDKFPTWPKDALATFGPLFHGPIITNGGYDRDKAEHVLASGAAQLVSFGNAFIANPDLVKRLEVSAPLAAADRATMYGGHEKGYIDYPTLAS